jgi:cholinesterase
MWISLSSNRVTVAGLLLLAISGLAMAAPFTAVVVYGDSLSDNGNLYAASGYPPAPYYLGRKSNGPVAVELLAQSLGTPLADFAWIGATTGIGNYADGGTATTVGFASAPGMQAQLAATQAALGPYLAGGLFIVWGGPDDFIAPSPLDATPQDTAIRGVGNLLGIVGALQLLGAQHILVPGMPDLGLTPYFAGLGPVAAAQASAITDFFNAALYAGLPSGVQYYDTSALVRSVVANPAAFGLTNATAACIQGATVCADPAQYLFWDDFPPTTAGHSIVAKGFEQAVPEPGTISVLAGLVLLASLRRLQTRLRL